MKKQSITWWNAHHRNSVYTRWILLVILNAAFPFFLSLMLAKTPSQIVGILFAVLSFIVIYAETESYLLNRNYLTLAKQLRLSAAIKISTIFLPFIDMVTGIIALGITHQLTGVDLEKSSRTLDQRIENSQQISPTLNLSDLGASYLTTMIDGFLLSIIVAIIIGLIRFIAHCRKEYREKHQQNT